MTLYKWSQTAAADATADSTINWAEGQAPSSVNDSARAMMVATAKYRDDAAGAIVTGGTGNNYTVSSYQAFDTLAHLSGQMIAFTPHITNGAVATTLNVDGLGAKPLRTSPGVELLAGTIIQGTPYVATYNNTDGAFYLHNFYGVSPYLIPLGAALPYFATSTPNSSFAFPFGQAISRTTYASLFVLLATNFGAGDGSTTFNLPDLRGRVLAGWDAMGGVSASRLTAASGFGGLFSAAGGETHALTAAEMPSHNHGVNDPGHTHLFGSGQPQNICLGSSNMGLITASQNGAGSTGSSATGISIQNAGGGAAHPIVQPTIACNYILRIL